VTTNTEGSTTMTTHRHTAESLTALIASRLEPDNAERVLEALKPLHGTLITTRLLDKLPGGRVEWRLSRHHGWTELANRAQQSTRGDSPDAVNLILARSEVSVPLDVPWVERENSRYFAGRRERNALRAQAVADKPMLTRLAFVMNEIEDLQHKLKFAKKTFAAFVADGEPCHPERYELERACGLRDGDTDR